MTTPVCVRRRIRQLDRQGLSHKEISRRLGVSRTTVARYANHGDYSPKPLGSGHAGRSLVDAGYSAVVDGWPAADLRMPVKQRHTATRVYERLVAECGFTGPYSSVRRRVRRWRRGIERGRTASPNRSGRREARRSISPRPGCSPCSARITGSGRGKGGVENAVGFVRRNLMVPMPSAESFQTLTRVWLDECGRVAGSDHCRHDVPVIELFEAEKDHMLPLPGVGFDPCDWRSVRADKTGAVTIDANRYPAGPEWRSMRLQAGVRVFEIELRDPDGGHIVMLERVWGKSARTQVDPASLLAMIARKPRIWGESPIRNDFPETVRALLDRMDARTRSDLLDDIRAVAADCGFAATVKAVETVTNAGRTVDRAAIGTCAKRVLEGAGTEGGQDLKRYDKYMKEAE